PDKATIEVPSSVAGTVKDVRVKQGDRIKVGQVVLTLDDGAGAAAKAPKEGKGKTEPAGQPKPQPAAAASEGGISQEAPGAAGGVTDTESGGGAQKGAAERSRGTMDTPPDERFADHSQGSAARAD